MDPVLHDLDLIAKEIILRPPSIAILSNVTGKIVHPGQESPFDSKYISKHCRQPVLFEQGIRNLVDNTELGPVAAWIELGPHATCLPMLKTHDAVSPHSLFLPSMKRSHESSQTMASCLCQLYLSPIHVNWRMAFSAISTQASLVDLPTYPFVRDKFWVPYKESNTSQTLHPQPASPGRSGRTIQEFALLSRWKFYPSSSNHNTATFETPISHLKHFIEGHVVTNTPLCPASVYIELAMSGVELARRYQDPNYDQTSLPVLRVMEFSKPLVYRPEVACTITTVIVMKNGKGTVTIMSSQNPSNTSESVTHARGEYVLQALTKIESKFIRSLPVTLRQSDAVKHSRDGQEASVFNTHTAYELVFPRVVKYSKEFQVMQTLTVAVGGMEGQADLKFPASITDPRSQYKVHPIFLDALLHISGLVSNMHGTANQAYICHQLGAVKVLPFVFVLNATYTLYCTNSWVSQERVMYSDAFCVQQIDSSQRIVAQIKGMAFRRLGLDNLRKSLEEAGRPAAHLVPDYPLSPISPQRTRRSMRVKHDAPKFRIGGSPLSHDLYTDVVNLVARILEYSPKDIHLDSSLDALGMDSLTSIELHGALREKFPDINTEPQFIAFCPTISDLVDEISLRLSPSDTSTPLGLTTDDMYSPYSPSQPMTPWTPQISRPFSLGGAQRTHRGPEKLTFGGPLETTFRSPQGTPPLPTGVIKTLKLDRNPLVIQTTFSGRIPLFLIHDGSGLANYYDRVGPLQRNVWSLHDPRFTSGGPWTSVQEMAERYCDMLLEAVGRDPIILGGKSFIRGSV